MTITHRKLAVALLGASLLAAPAFVLGQEQAPAAPAAPAASQTLKGTIVSHDQNHIVIRTGGHETTIKLGPGTKITATRGAGVLQRESRQVSDLTRGLPVEVNASHIGADLVASTITYKSSDMKTANQIQAGIAQTEAGVAANKQAIAEQEERLNNVGNLVAAGRTKVFFGSGKSAVNDQGKADLQDIAAKANGIKGGYRLAIVARADQKGNAEANKRLSAQRAAAVKTYLIEHCGVLPGNFVPATALGENPVMQDPDPPKNDAEARRVTVTIMVSGANKPG